ALPERPTEGIRLRRPRRHLLQGGPRVHARLASDEAPDEAVEAAQLGPEREVRAGVLDRRPDLEPVSHDTGIGAKRAHLCGPGGGNFAGIEAVEGAPVAGALPENRDPGEAGLRAFEAEQLEEPPLVVEGDPPLAIMVRAVKRVGAAPRAADGLGAVARRR